MVLLFCGFFPRSAGAENLMFCTSTRNQMNCARCSFHVLSLLIPFYSFSSCPRPARADKVPISQFPVSVKNFEAVSFRFPEVFFYIYSRRKIPKWVLRRFRFPARRSPRLLRAGPTPPRADPAGSWDAGAARRGAPIRPGVCAGNGGAERPRAGVRLRGAAGAVVREGTARVKGGPSDSKVWGETSLRASSRIVSWDGDFFI